MPIEHIHSFLVHPAKSEDDQPEISGTQIPRRGKLYEMLRDVYRRSPDECKIEIVFRPDAQGRQANECSANLLTYTARPSLPSGRAIAGRLQRVTTRRSGLGLLFLLKGTDQRGSHVLLVSRFPADQGILAQERKSDLSVRFVERIFMKSSRDYKSALFLTPSLDTAFLEGRAVDRQVKGPRDLSIYWINEFLESDLRTTGPAGSRRLAISLREAVKRTTDLDVKQELVAATRLLRGQQGRRISTSEVLEQLAISPSAREAVRGAFARPELIDEYFEFDVDEFDRHVQYRTVELDTGAMLVAEDSLWDQVFSRQRLETDERVRITTEGEIIDERLKRTK